MTAAAEDPECVHEDNGDVIGPFPDCLSAWAWVAAARSVQEDVDARPVVWDVFDDTDVTDPQDWWITMRSAAVNHRE